MNSSEALAKIDIVVQNVASFRIDPAVLARPDRKTTLIVSPANHLRLQARGRTDVFHEIVVLKDFGEQSLAVAVTQLLENGSHAAGEARLLCHDEYSLGTVASVREKLGIPGDQPSSLKPFTDKLTMKSALRGRGICMPRHTAWDATAYRADRQTYVEAVIEIVGLPAFVKPVNESGSVGAARLDSLEDLHTWASQHGEEHQFEIDEFLQGTMYHVDSAVQNGKVVTARAHRLLHPCHEYAAGRVCAGFTLSEDDPLYAQLVDFNRRVLEAFPEKPESGAFHHEIFVRPNGELVFLEIAARAPAALIPATSRIRWGLDIEEAHFQLQRGEEIQAPSQKGPFAAWLFFPKRAGEVTHLHKVQLASDHRWTWNVTTGEFLDDSTDIRDFAATVLLWNEDYATLLSDVERLDQHIPLTTR